jgi:hypothetical protein
MENLHRECGVGERGKTLRKSRNFATTASDYPTISSQWKRNITPKIRPREVENHVRNVLSHFNAENTWKDTCEYIQESNPIPVGLALVHLVGKMP